MVFSSTVFLFFFLPAVLFAYFVVPKKLKNCVLFLFSLIFYAWGEPFYVCIMLFSTVFDYVNGLLISHFRAGCRNGWAKTVLICSIVGNLGILGYFKYRDFGVETINALFGTDIPLLRIALPIGISFYTFQTMSYTIDVYRQKVSAQRNIIRFGTYVTMFPQLVAGPIVQYRDIEGQLVERRVSVNGFAYGIERFVTGLAKKVLLANPIGSLWDQISSGSLAGLSAGEAWLGAVAFSLQIYYDFSGYSDMAIGLGAMFGFRIKENFDHPYCAGSITEFWRRWHISLGAWFREYVYIPLGGNRRGSGRQVLNILVVWFLTGFWHGAGWNFVVWGLYFGILLILEKLWLHKWLAKHRVWSHIYTVLLVMVSWMIFALDDIADVRAYMKAMFGLNGGGLFPTAWIYYLGSNAVLLAIGVALCMDYRRWTEHASETEKSRKWVPVFRFTALAVLLLLSVAFLVSDTYNPFLYFRF